MIIARPKMTMARISFGALSCASQNKATAHKASAAGKKSAVPRPPKVQIRGFRKMIAVRRGADKVMPTRSLMRRRANARKINPDMARRRGTISIFKNGRIR